jgi:exopolysaccharide biosynthesis polyprenyl glycosylphosphotransferase
MGDLDAVVEDVDLRLAPLSNEPQRVVRSHHRDRDFALRRALLGSDMLALFMALSISLLVSGNRGAPVADALWLLPTLPAWAVLFRAYGLYQRPIRRFEPTQLDDVSTLFHALVIGVLGLWVFYKAMPVPRLNFEEVLIFGFVALPLVAMLRVAVRVVNLRIQGPERVFVVAPIADVRMLRRKLRNHPEYEMDLVGAVSGENASEEMDLGLSAAPDELEPLIASGEIDHLVVQLDSRYIPQERLVELMRACYREGVRFGVFPAAKNLLLPGAEVNHIEGMGFLSYHPPVLSRASAWMKRGLDLVLSASLLAVFALPMALIALAVKVDSRGTVFYKQLRVGKDGERFLLFKFRTMVPGAEGMTAELMAQSTDPDWLIMEDDPRVTRVGRFLRRTSLDELPQLWNVLLGEMSMVGPRPLSECDDEGVRGWERHRLDLVPGVTGHWQVLGRNTIPFREMVEIDYAYIASWSLLHDLKILARTVPVVLMRRGAN